VARYDRAFAIRARRAVAHGIADAETFQALAAESGVSIERIAEMLQADLENEGPIFGKFMRSLRGAATSAVGEAQRVGMKLGSPESVANLKDLVSLADMEDVIDDADPEELERLDDAAGDPLLMWVAMLVKTCNDCLPLHGAVMHQSQWEERGLVPGPGGTMHEGWNSECQCKWVAVKDESGTARKEMMAPMTRLPKKDENGKPIKGRTVRAVSQLDVDKARAAVDKAKETEDGRRTLRLMGSVGADEEDGDE